MANAVLDGVDGILLGAETLRGRYPVLTVDTITKICRQAEKVFDHVHHFDHLMAVRHPVTTTLASDKKSRRRSPLACIAPPPVFACMQCTFSWSCSHALLNL